MFIFFLFEDDTTEEKLMWVEKDIVQKADEAVPLLKPVLQVRLLTIHSNINLLFLLHFSIVAKT